MYVELLIGMMMMMCHIVSINIFILSCVDSEMKQYGFDLDYKDIMPENYDSLTAEETQLLGGDLEHTFLVKGVDQALLQKVCEKKLRLWFDP